MTSTPEPDSSVSSRRLGLVRGRACVTYAKTLLAERGEEGIPANELEAAVLAFCGGTSTSNKVLLIRACERGLIFAKQGTIPVHAQRVRYFDTAEHRDACPVLARKTKKERAQERRDYQNKRRADRKAAGIKEPSCKRSKRSRRGSDGNSLAPTDRPSSRTLVGEPIITDRTKVTIIPTRHDPRYHVPETHRGEFTAEWQAKRADQWATVPQAA